MARKVTRCVAGGWLAVIIAVAVATGAESVAERIEKALDELDEQIATVSGRPAMRRMKTARVELKKLLDEHDAIHTVMQTNSKGKVINEILRSGSPGRRYRSVARQSWFGEVAKQKPYYGHLEFRRRGYYLFWCYPVERQSGGFGGAVVVKIDFDKALRGIADDMDTPFRVTVEGDKVYAHSWDESIDAQSAALRIPGLEGVTIQAKPVEKTAAADTATDAAATPAAQQAATSADTAAEQKAASDKGNPWPVVITVVVLAILGGIIGKVVHGITRKRHERLMASIEGDEPVGQQPPSLAPESSSPPRQPQPPQDLDEGAYSQFEQTNTPAAGYRDEESYFEENATVVMPRTQVPGMMDEGRHEPTFEPSSSPRQPSPPRQPSTGDARSREEIYQQVRQELEYQFQQELARRTEQIKQDLYAQAREALAKSLGQYTDALVRHVEEIKGLAPDEPTRQNSLDSISLDLQRLAGKLQGGSQRN